MDCAATGKHKTQAAQAWQPADATIQETQAACDMLRFLYNFKLRHLEASVI